MNKEIERKWLVNFDLIPKEILNQSVYIESDQSYLSRTPEVRIRKQKQSESCSTYILTIKGQGDLTRTEVETPLDKNQYKSLLTLCKTNPIPKKIYLLSTKKLAKHGPIEINLVEDRWCYAEVEFKTEEDSEDFDPPSWFLEEVTYHKEYKMVNIAFDFYEKSLYKEQDAEQDILLSL